MFSILNLHDEDYEDVKKRIILEVLSMIGKTLVGKFLGRLVNMDSLNKWTPDPWVTVLNYGPIFHLLEKGWIGFIFRSLEDADKISREQWFCDKACLSLKPWQLYFNT